MIEIKNLCKSFGPEVVLQDIYLEVSEGNTFCILGKSGSGKSTLLRILAGLEKADAGELKVAGNSLLKLRPDKRPLVYLSQEPLLFPHLNVFRNLAFGLELKKLAKADIKAKVTEMAERLGLQDHLNKMPFELSGGQKQRVNFGRALIIKPPIFLLDEPFGSLDHQIRGEMQELFLKLREEYRMTTIFVTHDLKEALIVGDRFASLTLGRLEQYSSVRDFLDAPQSGAAKELDFWTKLDKNHRNGKP